MIPAPLFLMSALVSLVISVVRIDVSVSEDESSVEHELVRESELLLVLLDVSEDSALSNFVLLALLFFFSARTRFLRRSKFATSFSVSFLMECLCLGDERLERVRFLDFELSIVSLSGRLIVGDPIVLEVFLVDCRFGDVSRELNLFMLAVLEAALVLGFPLGVRLGWESRQ